MIVQCLAAKSTLLLFVTTVAWLLISPASFADRRWERLLAFDEEGTQQRCAIFAKAATGPEIAYGICMREERASYGNIKRLVESGHTDELQICRKRNEQNPDAFVNGRGFRTYMRFYGNFLTCVLSEAQSNTRGLEQMPDRFR